MSDRETPDPNRGPRRYGPRAGDADSGSGQPRANPPGSSPPGSNPPRSNPPYSNSPREPRNSQGGPVRPREGQPREPGRPVDPRAVRPREPGRSVDPRTGRPAAPRSGLPVDPRSGRPVDPRSARPVDPRAAEPRAADPRAARPVDPRAADPRAARPVDHRPGDQQPGYPDEPPARQAWSEAQQPRPLSGQSPYPHTRVFQAPPREAAGTRPPGPPPRGPLPPRSGRPQSPDPRRPGGSGRTRTPLGLKIGRVFVALLSIAVLVFSGIGVAASSAGQQVADLTTACTDPATCPGQTILLVGSDARVDADGNPLDAEALQEVSTELTEGGTSTDTMMLIHIPAGGGKATAVSIPRDVWIADPPQGPSDSSATTLVDYDPNKVNSYYGSAKFFTQERLVNEGVTDKPTVERESSNAGRKMLISVLEKFTGIHIDSYAEVNLYGFYLLSKALGGVPVCLVAAVNDPFSGAVFPEGPQEVEGSTALSFVRQRHGLPNGDLDRVRRQQAFLSGAISKVLSVGTLTDPSKLSDLIDAANQSIVLSQGFNLLDLASQMAAISSGNINFVTLPTHGAETSTSKDALSVNVPEVQALFTQIQQSDPALGTSAAESPVTATATSVDPVSIIVDVQNGTLTSGMAKAVSDEVAAIGYTRGQIADFPGVAEGNEQTSTTIRYAAGGEAAAAQVQAGLGYGELMEDPSVAAAHVLVVVGTDHELPPGLRTGNLFAGNTVTVTAGAGAGSAAVASAAQDEDTINAGSITCVN